MDPNEVYEEIMASYTQLEKFPEDMHLFCPKLSEDDEVDYEDPNEEVWDGEVQITAEQKKERIEDSDKRLHIATTASLLLGISKDAASAWLDGWIERAEKNLTTCPNCIRAWHKKRKSFLKLLGDKFGDEVARIMAQKLDEFDKNRIDRGLLKAESLLKEHGPMKSSTLTKKEPTAVVALYEALCCMSYLSRPQNRMHFNFVFSEIQKIKRPLRLGSGVIPTMTFFLFQEDEDGYRSGFAKAAWETMPPGSLTANQFEWAVQDYLASEISAVFNPSVPEARIKRFWDGIAIIIPSMSADFVLHTLRGMEVQPDIYHIAFHHLSYVQSPEVFATLIKGIISLIQKSPKAFWDALADVSPAIFTQHTLGSKAFPAMMARSLEPNMLVRVGDKDIFLLSALVKILMESLQPTGRTDLCDSTLHSLMDRFRSEPSREGKSACAHAALMSMICTLECLSDPKLSFSTALVYIDITYNIVLRHKDFVINCASLKNGDQYNVGLSEAALKVIDLALTLDSETFERESLAIKEAKKLSYAVERRSSKLWDAFIDHLEPSKTTSLANVILGATLGLRGVEKFLPRKREAVVKDPQKLNFNQKFEATAESIGRLIGRVSEFSSQELRMLSEDHRALGAIVACLTHGEENISDAAMNFIKMYTGEDSRSDALEKMLSSHPELFLRSFSDAVGKKIPHPANAEMFPPVAKVLGWYRDILDAVTDSASGLLRRDLSEEVAEAVKYWWKRQWVFLGYFFNQTRHWSEQYVPKETMETLCREAVEHADRLLAEDGLVANAIKCLVKSDGQNGDARTAAMKVVLDQPRVITPAYFAMLQLRDQWLLGVFARSVGKLVTRLNEFDMALPPRPLQMLRDICIKTHDGRFKVNSNLRPAQKAELLRALGTDSSDDEEVQFVSEAQKPPKAGMPKKQSSLAAWSKSGFSGETGTAPTAPARTTSKATSDEQQLSIMQSIKAQVQSERKPKPQMLSAAAIKSNQSSLKEARAKEQAERAKANAASVARAKAIREAFSSGNKIVAGEGSGLQGISGVLGKDHAPTKSEIMVDSSEEEGGDSDDEMSDLFGAGQAGKDAAAQRLKQLAAKQMVPVKKTKIQRSKKDLRARITPPMERLHEAILEWDIFHEGSDPPNGYKCKEVAKSYTNPVDYRETFFPMLVNEAWRSFVTSKDESTAKPFDIKITTRTSVDKFLEVATSMPISANKDKDRDRLSDGDIVLFSTAQDPLSSKESPHCLARVFKTGRKRGVLEVTYRITSKGNSRFASDHLLPGNDLRGLRITNMTTVEREFAALESLQYYDLMTEVLDAEPSPILNFSNDRIQSYQDNYQLNRGQAAAIINAKENDGFTLVQGPPGTGKTKTIIAMVGALLTGKISRAPPTRIKPANGADEPMAQKLLVCAPSNAAVDELVLRLKAGIKDTNGNTHKINVLRLGRSDAINAAVRDVTLDELVKEKMDAALNVNGSGNSGPTDREKLHQEAGEIKVRVAALREALEQARAAGDHGQTNSLQRNLDELRKKQGQIGAQIDRDKASGNTYAREAEIKRRNIQQSILSEAHVLCATLSGAGHDMFKSLQVEFETVIIDEAAQCVELSALIPLKYGASKCILVGDPKQLPPTVLSQSAARYGYDQSLFVRMQQNHPGKVHLLDCQYRMHPEISLYPSKEFYEGLLADGSDMAKLRQQPWHDNPLLGPYRFFDVEGIQERGSRGQSLVNTNEINVAIQIYTKFQADYASSIDMKGKIGIITPYKAQLFALRQKFQERWGEGVLEDIEFNTTDAFQGRECEIIIFSCVRASPTGGIGFMTDIRRMNVGLTRARSSLWILGDSRALRQGEFWNKLIEDSKARDRYTQGSIISQLRNSKAIKGSYVPPPPAVPAPIGNVQRRGTEGSDVEMFDVNDGRARQQSLPQQAPPQNNMASHSSSAAPPIKITVPGQPPARAVSQAPPIRSSVDMGRKRPASEEARDQSSANKRSVSNHPHPPTGPRAGAPRPPPRPTDPSAMQALGLAPPDRPAAQQPPPPQAPRPPKQWKKKAPANVFLQPKR
ncbi:DNA-binding protein SMUBP-2 [Pyricularia oryzae 70-15]|uniref:DNA-binding protein SMUBP-2 n=3 Tax=Pyricularia oryzae TaxID=318829 RepID=G4NIZ8_PYRO7|nr:DNA-binding protein SMUBP-2 [Pyricularia oryzae 70-15]EHA46214.1 DNA-binding protein SMUBP-2 [Pyricularia oryzae 70-15]ELQ41092.1 DNA-binding protein SMUBP-2 [Pyricularia oryzae Y34]KAI7920513.1 DNA-binding protein SMUBP-2 [Pyricularia oryzae]KAI7925276.1 DNA-binding protein SMUBP-2 [Pyricularia oryzae]